MPLTLEQYATYLDTRDLPWPEPPEPSPPKAKPHLVPLSDVRAVTWSVYGTLVILAGGELYWTHPNAFVMQVALDKTIQEFNMWASMSRKPGQPADYMRQLYQQVLAEQSTFTAHGVKHPETLSERVWESLIKKLFHKDYKFDTGFYGSLNEFSAKVAYFFHRSLQGTACYPGAAEALRHVRDGGLKQSLLADAQAFTPVQLQRGLTAQDADARLEELLDADLNALSCEVGSRKPADQLFRRALQAHRERGITPDQILHVGSRITQDIAPARRLGMRTALFAGDTGSLQATAEQLKTPATRPDLLLTDLRQIAEVVPGR
jgi:FMN phosphatase YigB (HAD superfamily)